MGSATLQTGAGRRPHNEIAFIVDQRRGSSIDCKLWLKIRWIGHGPEDDSWMKADDLDCPFWRYALNLTGSRGMRIKLSSSS